MLEQKISSDFLNILKEELRARFWAQAPKALWLTAAAILLKSFAV